MEKPQSQRPMPVAEMTPKEFESTGKSARTRRALDNMMEDFERALVAMAQTGENSNQ